MILKYSNKSSDPRLELNSYFWLVMLEKPKGVSFICMLDIRQHYDFIKKKEEDNDDGLYVVANVKSRKRQFSRGLCWVLITRGQSDWKKLFFFNQLWSVWTLDFKIQRRDGDKNVA